jgi:thiol-disulfide isomerase/thioredoxin
MRNKKNRRTKYFHHLNRILRIAYIILIGGSFANAQTIKGNLSFFGNESIKLEGFSGLTTYPIASTTMDEQGNFKLTYSKADYGVGYLMSADEKPLFVILSGEDIEIVGEALSTPETIKVTNGQENQWFEQYAQEHPRREQALSAWVYLESMYTADSLFAIHLPPSMAIEQEKQRIKNEDLAFLASLPEDSYVRWFLPTRKLVSSVSVVAQYRTDELPATIEAFRSMDYTDTRLYKSGLFREAIESHFWLLENSVNSLEVVFEEMKLSIDAMMDKLVNNEVVFNEVTQYLFDLLERHSLFQASEYLALKVLNEVRFPINNNLALQLETYRAMKIGKVAPNFLFDGEVLNMPKASISKLSDIQSEYTLVVFAASWCQKCTEEIPEIGNLYPKWKSEGLEVVAISLDNDPASFRSFFGQFPFTSICDYKMWEGSIVNQYYVFASPTMFLLNKNKEILLRPTSVKQMDAWVDWFLIGKN